MKQRRSKLFLAYKPNLAKVNVGSAFRWRCSVKYMAGVGTGKTPQEAFAKWEENVSYWGRRYVSEHPTGSELWQIGREYLELVNGDYASLPYMR